METRETTLPLERRGHPLVEDAMEQIRNELLEHPQPHTHAVQIRRRWWARLWYRFVRRWDWPLWEYTNIHLPCTGRLSSGGEFRFRSERDPEHMAYKLIGYRQWTCLEPIPQALRPELIRYGAVLITELALDSYPG